MADLDLLEFAAPLADRIEELKPLRLPMVVDEFRRSLMREVDFVTEASYTAKIKEELADDARVCVPAVYWDLTTSDVLTLERIAGVSLTKKAELAALEIDRKRLARDLVEIFLHQFFKAGLFHADPHSGNILVTPDGRIGLVDFGMAGRLSEELRAHLATSFIALTKKDLDVIADIYMEIGVVSPDTDVERLKRDLQEVLDRYYGIPTRCLDVRRCFNDALRIARDHHILLPRDFVLLGKSFVTMAMMARELDPDFDSRRGGEAVRALARGGQALAGARRAERPARGLVHRPGAAPAAEGPAHALAQAPRRQPAVDASTCASSRR